jgi:hypothetical protein
MRAATTVVYWVLRSFAGDTITEQERQHYRERLERQAARLRSRLTEINRELIESRR